MSSTTTPNNYTTIQLLAEDEKFNGENLVTWTETMLLMGRIKGLDLYWYGKVNVPKAPIAPTAPYPRSGNATPQVSAQPHQIPLPDDLSFGGATAVNDPNPTYGEYSIRDSVSFLTIWNNVKNPTALGLTPSGSSYDLWMIIQREYAVVSSLARRRKEDNLRAYRYTEGKITGEGGYAEKMRILRKEVMDVGARIDDITFITIFLDSFPRNPEWSIVTGSLMLEKNFNIIAARLQEYWLHSHGSSDAVVVSPTDQVAALKAEIDKLKALVTEKKKEKKGKKDITCTNPRCTSKEGHAIEDCWAIGGGKQGQYPPWWKGKRDAPLPVANLTSTSAHPSPSAGPPATQGQYFALSTESLIALAPNNSKSSRVLGDCAASCHFFNDIANFKNFRKLEASKGSSSKQGVDFQILGVGDVELRVIFNGKTHTICFSNVLYAPDIACNLIALGSLDRMGWKMSLGGGRLIFHSPEGQPIFEAILGDTNLYSIQASVICQTSPEAFVVPDIKLWHRRSAHIGEDRIRKAVPLLNGLEIAVSKGNEKCEPCILANHRRSPFPPSLENTNTPLDLFGIDLWGPSRVPSVGGNVYAMLIVDAGTSKKFFEALPDRTAERTLKVLENIRALGETQTGQKLKRIRTDNAGEFHSDLWSDWTKMHGIVHEFTAAYSSASNGMAERSIGVVVGMTRTLLIEAKMAGRWWAEAMKTAVYTGNLFPSSRHPDSIPEENWNGKRQSVAHLRPFGCIVYAHISANTGRSKLDKRSVKCQLVGYDAPGIYRCKIVGSDEIIRSRDVIFSEGEGQWVTEVEGESDEDYSFLDIEPDLQPDNQLKSDPNPEPNLTHSDNPVTPPSPSPEISDQNEIDKQIPLPKRQRRTSQEIWGNEPTRRSARTPIPSVRSLASKGTENIQLPSMDDELPLIPEDDEDETPSANNAEVPVLEPDNLWEPKTYEEAKTRMDLWGKPMEKELNKLDTRKAFTPVSKPKDMKVIGLKWVYALRKDGDGRLTERRARLVVKGFTQEKGVHYYESWAMVPRYESLRILLSIAAHLGLHLWSGDFEAAYLNAKPQGTNYLQLPPGFENRYSLRDGTETALLMNINIYGTMDAGHQWFKMLDQSFRDFGYLPIAADPCIRYKRDTSGYTATFCYTDCCISK